MFQGAGFSRRLKISWTFFFIFVFGGSLEGIVSAEGFTTRIEIEDSRFCMFKKLEVEDER